MKWKVIESGAKSADANMRQDEAFLANLKIQREPLLHLYEWERDAATFGYFVDPSHFLRMENAKRYGLDLGKRPTGGGIIFHNCDYAFSVLIPSSHPSFSLNPLDNYAFINRHVITAISLFLKGSLPSLLSEEPLAMDDHAQHFCMAKPTKFDVMFEGKKVGGAAQRKTAAGYLHQGSICLGLLPEDYLQAILHPDTQVIEEMKKHSYPLLGKTWSTHELKEARQQLASLLQKVFCESTYV